jgi:hypothetical protein
VDKSRSLVDDFRPLALAYAYELRQDEQIVASGRVTTETEVEVGDELTVAGRAAHVGEIAWSGGEARLLLEAAGEPVARPT